MKATEICTRAAELVGGPRDREHGAKISNFQNIAAVWNGILRAAGKHTDPPLDAHDVGCLLEGMKIARRYSGAFNVDDYTDAAGYAGCAGEIRAAEERAIDDEKT